MDEVRTVRKGMALVTRDPVSPVRAAGRFHTWITIIAFTWTRQVLAWSSPEYDYLYNRGDGGSVRLSAFSMLVLAVHTNA